MGLSISEVALWLPLNRVVQAPFELTTYQGLKTVWK